MFDDRNPYLRASPSPFKLSTWRDLLAPYPGNLGELCVGILTFGASIGCLLPPSPRSARNYKIDVPELFSDKIRSDLAQGRIQIVNDPV